MAPNVQILTGTSAAIPLRISWSATDTSGIASYKLQQSTDGAAFSAVTLNSPTDTVITVFRAPTHTYQFRVRATDTKGNTSAYAPGPTMTLLTRQETSTAITYVGTWTAHSYSDAYGGALKYATSSTARATFTFSGRSVAWVSPMASNRGIADVYVDGVFVQSVDLFSSTTKPRMIVFTRSWSTSSAHTLQIRVKGTAGRPRVDVDAFVFLK
jgi:hypothetical protein